MKSNPDKTPNLELKDQDPPDRTLMNTFKDPKQNSQKAKDIYTEEMARKNSTDDPNGK